MQNWVENRVHYGQLENSQWGGHEMKGSWCSKNKGPSSYRHASCLSWHAFELTLPRRAQLICETPDSLRDENRDELFTVGEGSKGGIVVPSALREKVVRFAKERQNSCLKILCLVGMVPSRHSVVMSICWVGSVLVELGLATGEPTKTKHGNLTRLFTNSIMSSRFLSRYRNRERWYNCFSINLLVVQNCHLNRLHRHFVNANRLPLAHAATLLAVYHGIDSE